MVEAGLELDAEVDRQSERILYYLGTEVDDEPAPTNDLAEAANVSNRRVLYRIDNHLNEDHAGLVREHHPMREQRYFSLTERGAEYLKSNWESIEPPQTVEEACDVVREAAATVDDFESRLQSAEGKVGGFDRRLDGLEDDIESAVGRAKEARQIANGAHRDLRELEDVTELLKERIEDVEAAVEGKADAGELDRRLKTKADADTVYENFSELSDAFNAAHEEAEAAHDRLDTVETTQQDLHAAAKQHAALRGAGFVGRLRWLLTGRTPEPE